MKRAKQGQRFSEAVRQNACAACTFAAGCLILILQRFVLILPPLYVACSFLSYLFVLYAMPRMPRRLLPAACVLYTVSCAVRSDGLLGTEPLMLLLGLIYVALCAVPDCAVLLAHRAAFRKRESFLFTLIYPLGRTLRDFLCVSLNVGNYLSVGTAWLCLPKMSQVYALIGEFGVEFVSLWTLSLAAYFMGNPKKVRGLVSLILSFAMIGSSYAYGAVRMKNMPSAGKEIRCALLYAMEQDYLGHTVMPSADEQLASLRKQVDEAAENGAELILLHEEYLEIPEADEARVVEQICAMAAEKGVPIFATADIKDVQAEDGLRRNTAYLIDGSGQLIQTYLKNNLVPIVETGLYEDGTERIPEFVCEVGGQELRIAYTICYDINNSLYVSQISPDTELLINASWLWDSCNLEQNRCSLPRAIETGTTYLQVSFDGVSVAAGPDGRLLAEKDTRYTHNAVVMMDVPVSSTRTVYNAGLAAK